MMPGHGPGTGPRRGWPCSSWGCQWDLVLDGARTAASQAGAGVAQHPGHHRVVLGDQRGEPADAFATGPAGQPGYQLGAQPAALPVIDDGDGDFGGVRVAGVPDVAGDA